MKKTTSSKTAKPRATATKKTTKVTKSVQAKTVVKARPVVKAKAAPAKTTRKKTVVAKKTTSKSTPKKGLAHHAKRVYRLTPKFVHGMLAGAFVGVVVVTSLGYRGPVHADAQTDADIAGNPACAVHADVPNNGTPMVDAVNGYHVFNRIDGDAYVRVVVAGKNCNQTVTLAAWQAPAANFQPYKQQVLESYVTRQFAEGTFTMHIGIPQCYFQIDLVRGSNPRGIDGGGAYQDGRAINSVKGGNKACTPPPKVITVCDLKTKKIVQIKDTEYNTALYSTDLTKCKPTVTPPGSIAVCRLADKQIVDIKDTQFDATKYSKDLSQCTINTPPAVITASTTPTALVNTGPGAVLVIFGLSIIGGYIFHMRHRHVRHRKHAHAK